MNVCSRVVFSEGLDPEFVSTLSMGIRKENVRFHCNFVLPGGLLGPRSKKFIAVRCRQR